MTQFPPPTTGPAGWYDDPEGASTLRYFDGRAWGPPPATHHVAPPVPDHPTLPLPAAVGAIVILVVSLLGGRLLIDALVSFEWPVLVYVTLLTAVGYGPSLWWCRYVSIRWGTGRVASDVGLRFRWADLGWGPLIWISAVMSQVVVAAIVLAVGVPTSSNTEGVSEVQADRAYVVALLITAVVAAPIVEEMVFRGVVLRGLLGRMAPWLAVAAQALLFGAAHVDPVRGSGNLGLAVILSAVGAAFGVAAYLLRRIGPTVLAHAIFNAVVLTIVLTGVVDDLQSRLDEGSVAQRAVVDQPHVAEPDGDEESAPGRHPTRGFERVRIDESDIVDPGERAGVEDGSGRLLDRLG
jgi:membrane protease YdiL (CAAX protease family)